MLTCPCYARFLVTYEHIFGHFVQTSVGFCAEHLVVAPSWAPSGLKRPPLDPIWALHEGGFDGEGEIAFSGMGTLVFSKHFLYSFYFIPFVHFPTMSHNMYCPTQAPKPQQNIHFSNLSCSLIHVTLFLTTVQLSKIFNKPNPTTYKATIAAA